jgi:hypothetical protein
VDPERPRIAQKGHHDRNRIQISHRNAPGCFYGDITPLCSLPVIKTALVKTKTHTPPNHGQVGVVCATLCARSQLLERVMGPYFGSAKPYDPPLAEATKYIIKDTFGYANRILK